MARLPVEIVAGVSLGLLTAVLVSTVVCIGSFVRAYRTDQRIPVPAIVGSSVLGTAAIGVGTEILSPTIGHLPRFLFAVATVSVLSVGAETLVERLLREVPPQDGVPLQRGRTLSSDAFDWIEEGTITVRATGDIEQIDGYPPFSTGQQTPTESEWEFPADLPLSELETRLEDRLMTGYELAACEVSIDEQGRAIIAAAPSSQSAQAEIPDGYRAISLSAAVPPELTAGDLVTIETDSDTVAGTVVTDGGESDAADEQVTVAVPTIDAGTLLHSDHSHVVVQPRRQNATAEAISLLEWANRSIRKLTLDTAAAEALSSDAPDARIVAVRDENSTGRQWRFLPDRAAISADSTAFVVGDHGVLAKLEADDRSEGPR